MRVCGLRGQLLKRGEQGQIELCSFQRTSFLFKGTSDLSYAYLFYATITSLRLPDEDRYANTQTRKLINEPA